MFGFTFKKDRDDFPKVMHAYLDSLKRQAEGLEEVEKHVHVGIAFRAKFEEQFERCVLSMWGNDGVVLRITTDNMPLVLPCLRWLRHKGYRCHTASDNPTARSKSWVFGEVGVNEHKWQIRVEATLSGGSDKCEYVQVGVKEEPIMELRCGGKKAQPETSMEIDADLE